MAELMALMKAENLAELTDFLTALTMAGRRAGRKDEKMVPLMEKM